MSFKFCFFVLVLIFVFLGLYFIGLAILVERKEFFF